MTGAVTLALPAAAPDPDLVSPGVLGFVVMALLAIATWLLLRSMNRQLRNISVDRDAAAPENTPEGTRADDGTDDRADDRADDGADDGAQDTPKGVARDEGRDARDPADDHPSDRRHSS